MSNKPQYKTDDGEVIEVSEEVAFEAGSFLELPDGRLARRFNRPSSKMTAGKIGERKTIVSDAMGFGQHQLAEMEADRKAHNFTDIEFVPDPEIPQFIQVHCGSEKAKRKYMEHRQFTDRNSSNGAGRILSPQMFEEAKELVARDRS